MNTPIVVLLLGAAFGVVAALSILGSGFAAMRWGRENHMVELAIRLAVFGVVLVAAAEVIGSNFGHLVRQYAAWFFGVAALTFVCVPWVFAAMSKRGREHEG